MPPQRQDAGGSWDILFQEEPRRSIREAVFNAYLTPGEMAGRVGWRDGINSGTLAVRADLFGEVMAEWEAIQRRPAAHPSKWTEQGAWNRLVLDAAGHGLRARRFEPHEIQFPLHLDRDWKRYKEAALVHCLGGNQREKIEFMFGLYLQKFYFDPATTFLNLLEM